MTINTQRILLIAGPAILINFYFHTKNNCLNILLYIFWCTCMIQFQPSFITLYMAYFSEISFIKADYTLWSYIDYFILNPNTTLCHMAYSASLTHVAVLFIYFLERKRYPWQPFQMTHTDFICSIWDITLGFPLYFLLLVHRLNSGWATASPCLKKGNGLECFSLVNFFYCGVVDS